MCWVTETTAKRNPLFYNLLSKSQRSPRCEFHIRLSSLCQQLVRVIQLPNLQKSYELQSFCKGSTCPDSEALLHTLGMALCWLCSMAVFLSFFLFLTGWGRITWERDYFEYPSNIIFGFLPYWLKVKTIAIVLIHIQIILSLLICTICFELSCPCHLTGCFECKIMSPCPLSIIL